MGKSGGGKPKGQRTAYACFSHAFREDYKLKHPNDTIVFSEFSAKCGNQWKSMSDQEKQRFHRMAEKDKTRHETEMATYRPPPGQGQGKKRKAIKDPNAPKRALSAFFWYCNEERPQVKEAMPGVRVPEIAKELGRRWNDCTEDGRGKYLALAAKDKARYEKEMLAYKSKKPKIGGPPVAAQKDDSDDEEESEEEEDEDDEDDD